jgi:hypothetical protein
MATVVQFECAMSPRATVTDSDGSYTCVIDQITDLNPQRSVSLSERRIGIRSLFPPTVRSRDPRQLIDLAQHAVDAAAEATLGETGGPGAIVMLRYRVATAVRGALRELDLDF